MARTAHKRTKAYYFGLHAETLAAWYLRIKGYHILAQRWRNAGGEIDVLAMKGDTLVAVEVKARATREECANSITPDKQRRMARAMEGVSLGSGKIAGLKRRQADNMRFDVIYITPGAWPQHIKDAWRL